MKQTVVVTSYYDGAATAAALRRLAALVEVRRVDGPKLSRQRLVAALHGAAIAIISDEVFDAEVLGSLSALRVICCDGVGVDHVDLTEATRRGVVVINAPVVH